MWDPAAGTLLRELQGHTNAVLHFIELPDGRLVTGGSDGSVRLWDVQAGACLAAHNTSHMVTGLVLLADGRLTVSVLLDDTVQILDAGTLEREATLPCDWCVLCLATLPDGRPGQACSAGGL